MYFKGTIKEVIKQAYVVATYGPDGWSFMISNVPERGTFSWGTRPKTVYDKPIPS